MSNMNTFTEKTQFSPTPVPEYFSDQGRILCYRIDNLQNSLVQYEKKLEKMLEISSQDKPFIYFPSFSHLFW